MDCERCGSCDEFNAFPHKSDECEYVAWRDDTSVINGFQERQKKLKIIIFNVFVPSNVNLPHYILDFLSFPK